MSSGCWHPKAARMPTNILDSGPDIPHEPGNEDDRLNFGQLPAFNGPLEGTDHFTLSSFNTGDALILGALLRERLETVASRSSSAIAIGIYVASGKQCIFTSVINDSPSSDLARTMSRRAMAAFQFGHSSRYMGHMLKRNRYALWRCNGIVDPTGSISILDAEDYASGGAVPIRLQGKVGIAAVVVIHGLDDSRSAKGCLPRRSTEAEHYLVAQALKDDWEWVSGRQGN